MHVQAFSLRKYTSNCHLPDCSLQDYIIILIYLGFMMSSGQIKNSKLYNSVSFGPIKNRFGKFDQTTKRSISTKGIRNHGKFEPSIAVAQKWWCLGGFHHRFRSVEESFENMGSVVCYLFDFTIYYPVKSSPLNFPQVLLQYLCRFCRQSTLNVTC